MSSLQDGSVVEKTTRSVLSTEDSTVSRHERWYTESHVADLTNDYC